MMDLEDWTGRNIPEAVMDDAAAWLALLDAERCHDADRLAFARWLGEDPCHRWAFEELSEVWARLHTLADVRPLLDDPRIVRFPARDRPAGGTSSQAAPQSDWTGLAASLLVVLGLAAHVLGAPPATVVRAPAGEALTVSLDDESRVELDSGTEIVVRIDEDARRVELVSGDAIFHVAGDRRPFVVKANQGSVAALGTAFAVSSTATRMNVAVLQGTVRVRPRQRQTGLSAYDGRRTSALRGEAALLRAGEGLEIVGDEARYRVVPAEQLDRELSWRHGIRYFEDEPLPLVVAEMRRYYAANILIGAPELADLRVSGRFRTGDLGDFLDGLSANPHIAVDRADPRWIVLRPAT